MSTRCAMIVMSKEIWDKNTAKSEEVMRAYRHCDGYPEGMGLDIARACMLAGEWPNGREGWLRKNNRNWCQPFLHFFMGTDANIEVEPASFEHGDIEYLYVVEGTRDLSSGLLMVDSYDINITIYSPSHWGEDYSKIMEEEPVFSGSWKHMIKWLGVSEKKLRGDE